MLARSGSYGFVVGGCVESQGLVVCHVCSEGLREPGELASALGVFSPSSCRPALMWLEERSVLALRRHAVHPRTRQLWREVGSRKGSES